MDPILILSPHFDDAVLSCGQLMAGRPDVQVVTVFTGTPTRRRMLTTYDRDSGFRSAVDAMRRRQMEDARAMRILAAGPSHHLDLLDNQYAPARDPIETIAEIAAWVDEILDETGAQVLVGPLGLAHPDHYAVAAALAAVAEARPEIDAWAYEDLPSRVLYPLEVCERLEGWRERFPEMTLGFLGTGDRDVKVAALEQYTSQLWALDPPTYLVPERFWTLRGQP